MDGEGRAVSKPSMSITIPEAALAEICRRRHVQSLWLFGSAVTPAFSPERSDLDFLVQFKPLSPIDHSDAYFGLLDDLRALFQRPVDLAEAGALRNPYFRSAVEASKVSVYAAA